VITRDIIGSSRLSGAAKRHLYEVMKQGSAELQKKICWIDVLDNLLFNKLEGLIPYIQTYKLV